MTSEMTIGRGNGRDQFGAGKAVGSSRKRNSYYLQKCSHSAAGKRAFGALALSPRTGPGTDGALGHAPAPARPAAINSLSRRGRVLPVKASQHALQCVLGAYLHATSELRLHEASPRMPQLRS